MNERLFNVQLNRAGEIIGINRCEDPDDIDHEGVVIDCTPEGPKTISVIDYGKGTVSEVPVWRILLEQKIAGAAFIAAGILGGMWDPMEGGILTLGFGALGLWLLFTKRVDCFLFKPFD